MDIHIEYLEENGTLWAKYLFGPAWERLEQAYPDRKLWLIPDEAVNSMDELNTRSCELLSKDLFLEVHRLRKENMLLKHQVGGAPPDEAEIPPYKPHDCVESDSELSRLRENLQDSEQAYNELREVLTWIIILSDFSKPYPESSDWQDFDTIDPFEGPSPNDL